MTKLLALSFSSFFAVLAASLSGCAKDNVAECEDWAATMVCGDFDFATAATCNAMGDFSCDLTTFYTCLAHNFACDKDKQGNESADVTGWQDCQELRTCD